MKNSTGNAYENIRKQAKMIKQRKKVKTCRDKKVKATQKNDNEEINQKVLAKEERLKRCRQIQTIQTKQNKSGEMI